MLIKATGDLWWKNAIIYCLDVETFLDANGDGIGDLPGLIQRVDYLAGIGVNCIWLMPFYPTPNRDDGYDVTDHFTVDPRLGTAGDFVDLLRTAQDRGIRVIIDLVVNHTSDQHPWFQAARADRHAPYRDYYVWRDEIPEDGPAGIIFPNVEDSNWHWDEQAGQYYLHRFYSHQPDLNIANPAVREHILQIIGYWLQLGVAGFRVDAVPFLVETKGLTGEIDFLPHDFLRDLRAFLARRRGDAVLLGEVNLPPQEQRHYFGGQNGDELHLLFNFVLNQKLYLALVREDAGPLQEAIKALPTIASINQWANFVTNHDELTLDRLTEAERQEVFAALGPAATMRLFDRGIRRRLPTMLNGDQRRIRMVYSLLFSLPGTPVLFYGEEIGMAENLDIPGRMSVRTPMQWSGENSGGFSTADPAILRRPLVTSEHYGPNAVNVVDQRLEPNSLLNWMERLIRRRRECPEFGWGTWQLLETAHPSLFAHRCDWQGSTIIAIHNLSAKPCQTTLKLPDAADFQGLVNLLGDRRYAPYQGGPLELELGGYGYRWFRMHRKGQRIIP